MAGLFVGTPSGLHALTLHGNHVTAKKLAALEGQLITHLAAAPTGPPPASALLAAAIPRASPSLHSKLYGFASGPGDHAGLHLIEVSDEGEAAGSRRMWEGDARSCALAAAQSGVPALLAVGVEPADVLLSRDGGRSWSGTDSFRGMPTRRSWTRCRTSRTR